MKKKIIKLHFIRVHKLDSLIFHIYNIISLTALGIFARGQNFIIFNIGEKSNTTQLYLSVYASVCLFIYRAVVNIQKQITIFTKCL